MNSRPWGQVGILARCVNDVDPEARLTSAVLQGCRRDRLSTDSASGPSLDVFNDVDPEVRLTSAVLQGCRELCQIKTAA